MARLTQPLTPAERRAILRQTFEVNRQPDHEVSHEALQLNLSH